MQNIIIRKDGSMIFNRAIPEHERCWREAETAGICGPYHADAAFESVTVTVHERTYLFVAKTPRGIRIFEEF